VVRAVRSLGKRRCWPRFSRSTPARVCFVTNRRVGICGSAHAPARRSSWRLSFGRSRGHIGNADGCSITRERQGVGGPRCGCWSLDHAGSEGLLCIGAASAVGVSALVLAFRSGLQWPTRRISPRSGAPSSLLPAVALCAARKAAGLTASIARRCGSRRPPTACRKVPRCHIHTCGAHGFRPSFASLSALDVVSGFASKTLSRQQTIFSGAENLSAQELASELAVTVSRLRFAALRFVGQLEHVTSALMSTFAAASGRWLAAAALALAGLLAQARKRAPGRCRALGPCCQMARSGLQSCARGRCANEHHFCRSRSSSRRRLPLMRRRPCAQAAVRPRRPASRCREVGGVPRCS